MPGYVQPSGVYFHICLASYWVFHFLRSPSGDTGFTIILCGHELKSLSVGMHRCRDQQATDWRLIGQWEAHSRIPEQSQQQESLLPWFIIKHFCLNLEVTYCFLQSNVTKRGDTLLSSCQVPSLWYPPPTSQKPEEAMCWPTLMGATGPQVVKCDRMSALHNYLSCFILPRRRCVFSSHAWD